jgi:hypothetical protein
LNLAALLVGLSHGAQITARSATKAHASAFRMTSGSTRRQRAQGRVVERFQQVSTFGA